jgi:uncharacterized membrane protein YeaQ/YmgE (transglycosylase-associated protein family)
MHMSGESLLVIIVVGVIAGWLAGQIVQGTGFGLVGDFIIGVVGAFIGSWLLPQLGVHIGAGMVAAIANATIGAVLCWSCSGHSEAQAATVAEVGGRANIAHCAARADMAWRTILTRQTARRMGSFLFKLPAKVRYICGCVSHGRREAGAPLYSGLASSKGGPSYGSQGDPIIRCESFPWQSRRGAQQRAASLCFVAKSVSKLRAFFSLMILSSVRAMRSDSQMPRAAMPSASLKRACFAMRCPFDR